MSEGQERIKNRGEEKRVTSQMFPCILIIECCRELIIEYSGNETNAMAGIAPLKAHLRFCYYYSAY